MPIWGDADPSKDWSLLKELSVAGDIDLDSPGLRGLPEAQIAYSEHKTDNSLCLGKSGKASQRW